jgi:hypothetical protein
MDAAGQLARDRGIATLGITVGLSGEYGPAQRLYGRRGYVPDGRGACQGRRPLRTGMLVTLETRPGCQSKPATRLQECAVACG